MVTSENFVLIAPKIGISTLRVFAQNPTSRTATQITPFQCPQASGAANCTSHCSPYYIYSTQQSAWDSAVWKPMGSTFHKLVARTEKNLDKCFPYILRDGRSSWAMLMFWRECATKWGLLSDRAKVHQKKLHQPTWSGPSLTPIVMY